jgi:hypothetical protein
MTKFGLVSRHLALGILLVADLALSPSIAWAVGSTPVTVVNPTNAPVPTTDANEPALPPFQATLFPHSSTTSQATDTFTVPAGRRLPGKTP